MYHTITYLDAIQLNWNLKCGRHFNSASARTVRLLGNEIFHYATGSREKER